MTLCALSWVSIVYSTTSCLYMEAVTIEVVIGNVTVTYQYIGKVFNFDLTV